MQRAMRKEEGRKDGSNVYVIDMKRKGQRLRERQGEEMRREETQ